MAATATTFESPVDSKGIEAWLKRLPADARGAFAALRQQVQSLGSLSLAPQERYEALERMRGRTFQLMTEQRGHYLGKAIPLAGDEHDAWESCVGVWEAFYFAYALCTDSASAGEHAAAAGHRALDSLARAMREHAYGYRAVPDALWKEFNNCYRSTEGCQISDHAVEDPRQPEAKLTCKSTYLTQVLYDAAQVYALSPVQMEALEQLLPGWVLETKLSGAIVEESSRSPLAVDVAGDCGARLARSLQPCETLRFVDTTALAPRLRDLAAQVRTGTLAIELAATRSLERPAIERLLTHLYIQWCSAGSGRLEERRETPLRGQAAVNMHSIHFQISGRAFRQPGMRYTRDEEHDLATFGHITERTEQRLLTGRSSALEPWEVVNQSASGMLGVVRHADLASRIAHGQLVAMRTSSIDPPLLALVQRLRVEADGVAVRPIGDPALKYERALSVAADPERNVPAHLILQPGRFALGSTFELHSGRAEKVVVKSILDRGPDHERVTFASA
jgi:hypothetical protein